MPRQFTSILFATVLTLSLALAVWWALLGLSTTADLAAAGGSLQRGDIDGAARALGAEDVGGIADLAASRRWMFASEGTFFTAILLIAGWLYFTAVRREQDARRTQDRFLAAATHELKTPLATISLLLESLQDDRVPPEKVGRYVATGLRECERLRLGLDNVLTAAGLRATRHAGRAVAGDLVADVQQALRAMEGRALACGVALTAELPEHMRLERDPVAMQLVLCNLLDNAIKYSPAGSTVHVHVGDDGGAAVVRIADAGRGLDADELEHAFAPFWRGSDEASGGTGLGLHLVRELVAAHGGDVAAASAGRDRGAVFTVRLPRRGAA